MRDVEGQAGFTVVEMLVTVVLAGVFIGFFVQMFRAGSSQQISMSRQSSAQAIAKSNLSKFPKVSTINPAYTCSTAATNNPNNLMINPSAPGTVILTSASTTAEPNDPQLPNLTQEVRAYSPLGCLPSSGNLVKLVSKVRYGYPPATQEVEYATYVQQ